MSEVSRPNFYKLLEIDPSLPWSDEEFRNIITNKQKEWTKKAKNPQYKQECNGYLQMVQLIEQVMSDPESREQEKKQALKIESKLPPKNENFVQFEAIQINGENFPYTSEVDSAESNYFQSPSKWNNSPGFIETSQQAFLDVLRVFKSIWNEPTTGLQNAIKILGNNRIFNAGIVLCILFVLFSWMAGLKIRESLTPWLSLGSLFGVNYSTKLSFSEHLRIILVAIISVLSMIGVLCRAIAFNFPNDGCALV
ncbi:hypothetical protein PCC7424_5402 (plasmid) [Gloeothece citriformis PCC 7424]|uniref:Uncharacterized protein n=1 Tax=Gloeothece citriformis (strain PCC 7424) TaxID=65393 RepID=B7KMF8_GLOC7|nr:hypothetical protein [Gloeothece citriformis]ACK73980.1 hypothetical protein PCC7424_5402 [Gloeothece citriformis PCC 7424]